MHDGGVLGKQPVLYCAPCRTGWYYQRGQIRIMVYARLLSLALIPLAGVYYLLCILQLFGLIRFTKARIEFPRVLIPFYYFFK